MRYLITGGLGFIGSNYIRLLLSSDTDIEVVNVDKIGYGANPDNLQDLVNEERYVFWRGDIADYEFIEPFVAESDVVVNFAAETHVDRSITDPESFIRSNYLGTYSLLEAERKCDRSIRHVQISTDEVYGDILKGSVDEESLLKPSNPYSATKAAADMLCLAYARTYNLDITITRCTNNFGPYQFPEKLIPKTIIRALHDQPIPVYGTGEAVRDWIYVLDHCEAVNNVLDKGRKGEIYNISSGNEITVNVIVQTILDHLDKSADLIKYVEDRPGHDMRYSLDSNKLRTKLHWNPKFSFSGAIKETIQWYLKNEWYWKPLLNDDILTKTPRRLDTT